MKKFIENARKKGFTKRLFNIRGWINGGYDYSHPDIWPPEPALGDYRELAALLASDQAVPFCLHDNYQDIYDHVFSFPNGVLRRPDGSFMPGRLWAGGQAYMLNFRDSLNYVKRNWEKIRELNPDVMFPDRLMAAKLLQSFEHGNTYTRLQDRELKAEILKSYCQQQLLMCNEESADFGEPYCDWFENRHERRAGETIPLWSLVFMMLRSMHVTPHFSKISHIPNGWKICCGDTSCCFPYILNSVMWRIERQIIILVLHLPNQRKKSLLLLFILTDGMNKSAWQKWLLTVL